MTGTPIRDLVGIGIGPFNLGLACLSDPLDLDELFLDERNAFEFHRGVMLEGSTIQVPFLADLVSLADPTSRFSFLNWLKHTDRLYPFYIRESFYPLRAEYEAYCRWACEQLDTLRWGRRVVAVEHDETADCYIVRAELADGTVEEHRARHVVVGIGSEPYVPPALARVAEHVVHSASFLPEQGAIESAGSVAVIGSGQSAAEIYRTLLDSMDEAGFRLDWITRAPRFFPMEYTKLTLEMTSPDYTDYFHALPLTTRDRLSREHRGLYKGISSDLINDIYDTLYRKSVVKDVPTTLLTETEVVDARWDTQAGVVELTLENRQAGARVVRTAASVVLATGYRQRPPTFLDPVRERLAWDERGRLAVARNYAIDQGRGRVFVQNGEEHTHGLTAPDLGFGCWRNASVLASVLGFEPYHVERRIAFQDFGAPVMMEGRS